MTYLSTVSQTVSKTERCTSVEMNGDDEHDIVAIVRWDIS